MGYKPSSYTCRILDPSAGKEEMRVCEIVAACTRDIWNARELMERTASVARRLDCPMVLMVIIGPEDDEAVVLERAYRCARAYGAEMAAFTGERALNRMLAEAQRRRVCCLTTMDDAELLSRVRLAFGYAQALDVSTAAMEEPALAQ